VCPPGWCGRGDRGSLERCWLDELSEPQSFGDPVAAGALPKTDGTLPPLTQSHII